MPYPGPFFVEIRIKDQGDTSLVAYDVIYSEGDLSQIGSFYRWYCGLLDLKPGGRFLDVSCGAGEMVELAAQAAQLSFGVDISEQAARTTRKRTGDRAEIGVSAGEALPFAGNSFDIITNIGSLEHFNDPAKGVQEMSRVLKPDGKAVILVPNTFSLLDNVWAAMTVGITPYDNQPIQRYGARQDWTVLLERNGLSIKRVIKYERAWPRTRLDWKHTLRHPRDLVRLLISPFLPTNLSYAFIFICEPSR